MFCSLSLPPPPSSPSYFSPRGTELEAIDISLSLPAALSLTLTARPALLVPLNFRLLHPSPRGLTLQETKSSLSPPTSFN
nr:hypothetical protein At5g45720 [Arabidopsis thaliana]